jgi:RNase H-like domain found in reverse transcriptase
LAIDPTKLKGILDWPAPKTVKEVQSFLGFGNFYRCFVKGFSHLAHPLNDLLKKDKKFVWSEECQESFEKQFTEEPVLMMPDHLKPFQIQVDSLLFATGDILSQMDVTNISFLLSFFFDMRLPYDFHFTYPDMSLPAEVHESPNTCTTCVCLTVNTPFPTV